MVKNSFNFQCRGILSLSVNVGRAEIAWQCLLCFGWLVYFLYDKETASYAVLEGFPALCRQLSNRDDDGNKKVTNLHI